MKEHQVTITGGPVDLERVAKLLEGDWRWPKKCEVTLRSGRTTEVKAIHPSSLMKDYPFRVCARWAEALYTKDGRYMLGMEHPEDIIGISISARS